MIINIVAIVLVVVIVAVINDGEEDCSINVVLFVDTLLMHFWKNNELDA
jgi:hypothetical protein